MAATRTLQQRMFSESSAILEFGAFSASLPWFSLLPKGSGDPVLVLPGLAASDRSTTPLRSVLQALGHRPHRWQLGRNPGPTRKVLDGLVGRLEALTDRYEAPVHIVGWSLGGAYGRGLARRHPDLVRQVITLGSPIRSIEREYDWEPPDVPLTNVYSKRDAVVPWRDSCDIPGPRRQNIEIDSSHLGLGHHPATVVVVADRLTQDLDSWVPFTPPRLASRLFPAD